MITTSPDQAGAEVRAGDAPDAQRREIDVLYQVCNQQGDMVCEIVRYMVYGMWCSIII